MQTLETKQYLTSTLGSIQNSVMINSNESDLNRKVTKALEKCTSCIYSIANEPTLACYCIEEHLIKTGVQLTDKRDEMRKLDKQLSGAIFDIEFSIESIKQMKNSNQNFKNTQDLIKDAIFCKQQIDYNNLSKRKFQLQMEKDKNEMSRDHSVNDFRNLKSSTSSTATSKRNAFQRFSTSFEASIEGIASSASIDFKEFINKAANISNQFTNSANQATSSGITRQSSSKPQQIDKQQTDKQQIDKLQKDKEQTDNEQTDKSSSSNKQPINEHKEIESSTSSKILNEIIKEEENELIKENKLNE